jgi:hypothetical protein
MECSATQKQSRLPSAISGSTYARELREYDDAMNKTAVVILVALSASIALADDFKTVEGKEYKNVTVTRVEPDGIVLSSKSGISKIYFTELPKEVQERFHYDSTKAAAYSAEQNAAQEQLQKEREKEAQEAQRQKAEEAARPTALAPTPTATPVRAAESHELASIRAEAEIREAETRGDHFGAEVARIRAYYDPRINAATQAGDTKLANQLHELKMREFYQAVGRTMQPHH